MNLIALDFETATNDPDSPCEMGLAIVRNGQVAEVRNWLIKPRQWPYFSPFTIAVHGIRPEHVAHAPSFAEVWEDAMPLMQGNVVVAAHNAAFDMNVLRSTLISHPPVAAHLQLLLQRKPLPPRVARPQRLWSATNVRHARP
jgi:DNA polymerase-3 subunit epsilon